MIHDTCNVKHWKISKQAEMCERKKTGVHGTLEMIPLAWKFDSKQLLCKTLNSRAVLNMVKKGGKCAHEAKRKGDPWV